MLTKAGAEAQGVFPVNPSHTSMEQCSASLAESKLERFVRCLGSVKTDPSSLLQAPGLSPWRGQANGDGLGWRGEGAEPHLRREAILLVSYLGKRAVLSSKGEREQPLLITCPS